jgi:DNA-directed RNA polymerase subunit RPC12/RpoP
MLIRFACPKCGRHISETRAQIGITVRCPNCNAAVTIPKTSTLPLPPPAPLVRFACPSCGQHISATHAQIGITAPCPNCNAAVTVPKTSTLPPPALGSLIRLACPKCGQHLSATQAQIGVTAPCPNCKEAVIVPPTSTLPPPRPVPLPAPVQTKFREKKRYETTVILIDDSVALLDNRKKLTKWTNDFTDARNWLIRELDSRHGEQYVAGIFDHEQNRSVLKMNGA